MYHYAQAPAIKFHPAANATESASISKYSSDTQYRMGVDGYRAKEPHSYREGLALPSNVLHIPAGGERGVEHSAAYPVALPAWFLRLLTDPGDLVYDPFLGSGTTLVAATNLGRVCYGTELSPRYCDVILDRWSRHTGEQPQLLDAQDAA